LCGISIEHGIAGPNANFANGAAGGLEAVAAAAAAVRRGEVALAIAGGSDSLLQPEHQIDHLVRGRLWSGEGARPTACRPFTRGRCGYLLGEAAAVVVVESAAHALARGARVYGELLGDGETTAAKEEDGAAALAAAARAALAGNEGAPPDALFGQGIGTPEDDRREAAVARAAGGGAPLTAATAALGYTGAASGVLALAHALWSLDRGVLPPTLGRDDPDPECAVELVERAERRELRSALVWASQEGWKHVAVLAGRFAAQAAGAEAAA
jgi:3-oxoacyl-(acyl-carrier-protein) synthase